MWGALVVLVLGMVGAGGGWWWLQQQHLKSAAAYVEAESVLRDAENNTESLEVHQKALEEFLQEYGGSVQAPGAWMRLARLAWETDDLAAAQQAFQQAASHRKVLPTQRAVAWIGLAKIAERQQKPEDAARYYEQLRKNNHLLLAAWHQGHADFHAGRSEQARKQFEILLQQGSRTPLEDFASELLRFLP